MLKYINEISEMSLFHGIKKEELPSMLGCLRASVKKYRRDEIIFLQSDNIKSVGVILSGTVEMYQEDMWGNKTVMLNAGKGDLFGETFACGTQKSAIVSFRALTNAEILFLAFDQIMHSCASACFFHQKLVENMITLIANKNIRLMEKVDVISKSSLREKIAAYLTIQAENNDSMKFDVPLGRVQLAEYLHADRSALTRELNNMKKAGLITFDRNTFEILKPLY